jgi:hypothetical protein
VDQGTVAFAILGGALVLSYAVGGVAIWMLDADGMIRLVFVGRGTRQEPWLRRIRTGSCSEGRNG